MTEYKDKAILAGLTYVGTKGLVNIGSIRYFTTVVSGWRYNLMSSMIQVDCSIMTYVPIKYSGIACISTILYRNQ